MVRFIAVWLAALTLLAAVLANPVPRIEDIHSTTLDLYAVDDGSYGRFAVRVERVDAVADVETSDDGVTEEGTLLGARVADIIVVFDVTPKGEVSVNGVPVPMGITNMQVEADVVTEITPLGQELSAEEVAQAFDKGLVGLSVHVEGETISDGEVELTRLIIAEQITEINGQTVEQQEVVQQVIEVHPDGSIIRHKPCAAAPDSSAVKSIQAAQATKTAESGAPAEPDCASRRFVKFFRNLPTHAKIALSVFMGVFLGLVATALVRIFAFFTRPARTVVYDIRDEDAPFIAKVAMEEDKLPAYTHTGYAKVEDEEKQ